MCVLWICDDDYDVRWLWRAGFFLKNILINLWLDWSYEWKFNLSSALNNNNHDRDTVIKFNWIFIKYKLENSAKLNLWIYAVHGWLEKRNEKLCDYENEIVWFPKKTNKQKRTHTPIESNLNVNILSW